MYIIAGLGNPGSKYEGTRHNVGFAAIDELAKRLNVNVTKIKFKGLVGEGKIAGEKVYLIKPQTYMNKSGESIREICNFYKVEPSNLIVIVDDIDIEFATVKIKQKGSAGTHNGLKSIIYQLQRDDFPRVKIGVGKKRDNEDLANFILGGFTKSESAEIEDTVKIAVDGVIEIIENGIDSAMNKYNKRVSK
ncbi:aminoacyl-tRNA hydrolase [Anaerosphaera multitolerans]|uniref:Peptidyl-tRNA hydrolase n=1 Tax=Anaerosphaera multitolerans TaxID=2487351 RepID=A0A437S830_9FIRM|nr:aminoacyl-tRNA hydrolase [Anaerosphaera multitolerans]RVU55162.1 aminoacyl-tRNA hydrolase [Anaerosphaera multitolerans]